jgi:non-ribosomal peptide synthetase component F
VCWVFCTSGSESGGLAQATQPQPLDTAQGTHTRTGPRGVLTTHSAAVNYVKFHPLLPHLLVSADEGGRWDCQVRVLLWSARTFDPSAGDVFATLVRGGVVCLWPPCKELLASKHTVGAAQSFSTCEHTAAAALEVSEARQWTSGTEAGGLRLTDLTQALVDSKCTHVCTTPSLWSRVGAHSVLGGADAKPKHLQVVGLGGEVMSVALARRWSARVRLVNLYGCTECTVYQTSNTIAAGHEDVMALGTPLPNLELRLSLQDLALLAPSQHAQGILAIRGVQVPPIYVSTLKVEFRWISA